MFLNALTVDVEDWFHVSAFRGTISFKDWENQESRIIKNVGRVLRIFEEHQVKATFYILGWAAEKNPEIVTTIRKYGHEIGSHSYAHGLIYEHSRDDFLRDLDKSVSLLERITGESVLHYRAPSFSITKDSIWALEELSKRGIQYDSSIFPIKHDIGGIENMPRFPFYTIFKNGNRLFEFPLATVKVLGENIPISGGGYLRLLPYWFIKNGIKKLNEEGIPVIVYFHPWEVDPDQPRLKLDFSSRFRHYTNLDLTEEKLGKLLTEFRFTSLGELSKSYKIDYRWPSTNNKNNHAPHQPARNRDLEKINHM